MRNKRLRLVIAMAILVVAAGPIGVHSEPTPVRSPGVFRYGVNLGHRNGAWGDAEHADLARAAGATSHRPKLPEWLFDQWGYDIELADMAHYQSIGLTDLTAFLIGPTREHSQMPPELPAWRLDTYAPRNLYEPIWQEPGVANPDNYWAAYVYETVRRYHPYVRTWEVWNEPDFTANWGATQDDWWLTPPAANDLAMWHDSVFAYIRLLRITHEVVQSLAPEDKVAVGGLGYPSFLDAILRYSDNPVDGSTSAEYPLTGGAYFETVSFHNYPHYAVQSLESGTWYEGWNSDEAVDGFMAKRRNFEYVLETRGYDGVTYPRKQFISTETGIASKPLQSYAGGGTLMRNYLGKIPVVAQTAGMMSVHWYMLTDLEPETGTSGPYSHMGLYTDIAGLADPAQAVRKPDAYAYETVSMLLDGRVFDPDLTADLALPPAVRGYAFRGASGNPLLVAWARTEGTTETASAELTLQTQGSIELYRWDHAATGVVTRLIPVGGKVTVTLDSSPHLLALTEGETDLFRTFLPQIANDFGS